MAAYSNISKPTVKFSSSTIRKDKPECFVPLCYSDNLMVAPGFSVTPSGPDARTPSLHVPHLLPADAYRQGTSPPSIGQRLFFVFVKGMCGVFIPPFCPFFFGLFDPDCVLVPQKSELLALARSLLQAWADPLLYLSSSAVTLPHPAQSNVSNKIQELKQHSKILGDGLDILSNRVGAEQPV